ncbi:DUF2975 domain-containing protein [Sphingomonas endolithica]|uniref:DUF2975 domain-containing protein n=1 Tax=Sphingomonas endolithica TaxID=2972485 RepID=UPI0021AE7C9B|nr:DUF2975 domain-containing protein [Sphingomonas sp. ZFBP2030]
MNDRLLGIGATVLKVTNILNWMCVVGFAVALLLSFPFAPVILAHLAAKYTTQPVLPILIVLRFMCVLGLLVGPPVHVVLTRLRAIVATAQSGDPFVARNAGRLQAVGWALLAIQLLDVTYGLISWGLAAHHVDTAGWAPSLGGWIAVLMVFVLARVFKIGARMRDELELTV